MSMAVKLISYHPDFVSDLHHLTAIEVKQAAKAERLLQENPFHPSLRLHALHGTLKGIWTISVNRRLRIFFQTKEAGYVCFLAIGPHEHLK